MTKVFIGVDGSDRSEDAIAFGHALAVAAGAPVILATVHQTELASLGSTASWRTRAAGGGGDDARPLCPHADRRRRCRAAAAGRPLTRSGVAVAAEQDGAGIIVVGSSHIGRLGRVLPGSTAERLFHGAPCLVAVVPVGFGAHGLPEHPVIGCGYQATDDGAAALGAAEELALALGGSCG